jgi:glutamate/tyrosine decarboxylase-like PLP-dependent enzyme
LLHRRGWDVARKGLYGAPKIRVVASADAHAAVHKSISMLGLGSENVELVPVDDQGRMRADQMPKLDEATLVVTQAGNVNSGAIDPVGPFCEHAFGFMGSCRRRIRPLGARAAIDAQNLRRH